MTQTITLPKKWQVEITAKNAETLENWRRQQPGARTDYRCQNHVGKYLLSFAYDGTYLHFGHNGAPDTPTISFEDFQAGIFNEYNYPVGTKLVLKPGTTVETLQPAFDAVGCCFHNNMQSLLQHKDLVFTVTGELDKRKFLHLKSNHGGSWYWPASFFQPVSQFTPIAMKCSADQFEAAKPFLEKAGVRITSITGFQAHNYLVNNYRGNEKMVTNVREDAAELHGRTVYHTWDMDLFLNCCGITKKTQTTDKPMNTTIKVSELKKIHDVACSTWKTRIEAMVPGPFAETVDLTLEQIEAMFAAANTDQTEVLEKVFPDYTRCRPENAYRSFGKSLEIDLTSDHTGMYIRQGHSRRNYQLKEIGLTAPGELYLPDGTVVNFPEGTFFLLKD